MKKKLISFLIFTAVIILLYSCGNPESFTIDSSDTNIIIWDPERILAEYKPLTDSLKNRFPDTVILSEFMQETAVIFFEKQFKSMPKDALCIFIVISPRPGFRLATEWNLWLPELWRAMDCRGKILIADTPWAEECFNSLKTKNADTVWVVNGKLGHLRQKLPKSLLVASCRFDESNLISRGIDGETKTPLFSWYFLDALKEKTGESTTIDVISSIEQAVELTQSARSRGVVSKVEEVLFFNRSQINKGEFRQFPNPLIWNGLAKEVNIEVRQ